VSGIVLFAYADVGHAGLALLLERGAPLACVYTYSDRAGEHIWFPSVARLAAQRGIAVRTDRDLNDPRELADLSALAPDLILSLYYRDLLPDAVLSLPPKGAFNMHGSLLPKYRGRAPVNWAVLNGETETGATLHVMTARADAGDIVDQQAVPIGPDDTAAVVQERVRAAALLVLDRQLDALLAGRAPRRAQPTLGAYHGRRTPDDGRIDWNASARSVHDLVRAVSHPYPGAFGELGGQRVRIWRTRVATQPIAGAAPGTATLVDNRLHVTCGDGGAVEILRSQRDGAVEEDGAALGRALGLAPLTSANEPAR